MLLQYASDLHLDQRTKTLPRIDARGSVLVLAGDLGNPATEKYWEYLAIVRPKFSRVILVPGNHEYLYHSLEEAEEYLKEGCAKLEIDLLQCGEVDIDGVRFIGCTLWTRPNLEVFEVARAKKGRKWTRDLTHEKFIELHEKHAAYLDEAIGRAGNENQKTVVITHHAPLHALNGQPRSLDPSMFVSAQDHLFRPPVVGWICGHTHFNTIVYSNGIPCMTNCSGYPGEGILYRPDRIFRL